MEFKNKLKLLRKLDDVSQRMLAEDLNISQSLVAQWERGACTPNLYMLERIADYFKTDINYLLDYESDICCEDKLNQLNKTEQSILDELKELDECQKQHILGYIRGLRHILKTLDERS